MKINDPFEPVESFQRRNFQAINAVDYEGSAIESGNVMVGLLGITYLSCYI